MNRIPGSALAATLALLAISGCAAAAPTAPPAALPAAYDLELAQTALVDAVTQGWLGNHPPAAHWIETTALLICKREGVDVPQFTDDPVNQQLVVEAALEHLCPA